jgi:hypothetical protein
LSRPITRGPRPSSCPAASSDGGTDGKVRKDPAAAGKGARRQDDTRRCTAASLGTRWRRGGPCREGRRDLLSVLPVLPDDEERGGIEIDEYVPETMPINSARTNSWVAEPPNNSSVDRVRTTVKLVVIERRRSAGSSG